MKTGRAISPPNHSPCVHAMRRLYLMAAVTGLAFLAQPALALDEAAVAPGVDALSAEVIETARPDATTAKEAASAQAVPPASTAPAPPARRPPGAFPGGGRLPPGVIGGFRWMEDWSHLADPAKRTGSPLERLKYIPLGRDDVFLSLGGEVRYNYTYWSRINLGTTANEHLSTTQQRVRLTGDLQLGANVRAFVELGDNQEFGAEFATPPNRDRWDVQQAFVDLTLPMGDLGQLTVRPGRFEMPLGAGRLMGVRDGVNVRFIYQGVRATWDNPNIRVDAFSVEPVTFTPGAWDNEGVPGASLNGAYVTLPRGKLIPNTAIDLFYFDTERARARFAGQIADEERKSLGGRLYGKAGAWDYDLEGVRQFGSFGASDIEAWSVMFDGGYTLSSTWKPRLGVRANAFSGDEDLDDGEINTFAPPFPRLPLYSDAGWFNFSNMIDLFPNVTVKPTSKLTVMTGVDFMWRESAQDGVYAGPTNFPLVWPEGGGRYVGRTFNLLGEYALNNNLGLRLYYARFEASDAVKAGGGDDSDYFGFWTDLRF